MFDRNHFFIFLSAFLLHLSLYEPCYFFWIVFIWLIPLFYTSLNKTISFIEGFFWGLIFYSFHLFPVTILIIKQAYGPWRFGLAAFLIFYCALHSGLWFFFAKKTINIFEKKIFTQSVIWIFWTTFYIIWLPKGLLWISGQYIGYPFSNPLLPLTSHPSMLWFIKITGENISILFLVSFSMLIALFFNFKKIWLFFISFLFISPFFAGFFISKKKETVPDFFKKVGHVSIKNINSFSYPMDAAQEIYYKMISLLEKHPKIKYIVMPELIYRFPLNKQKHIISMWNNNILHDEIQLLIGACRQEKNKIFNSLYWIKNGKIQKIYDKSRLMPLVEYIPNLFKKTKTLKTIFLNKSTEFSEGFYSNNLFKIDKKEELEPFICADFFLGKKEIEKKTSNKTIILLIFNDQIFLSNRFNKLLSLNIIFNSIKLNKFILAIGFKTAFYSTPSGRVYKCLSVL